MENSIKPTEPNTFVKNGQMTDVDSGLRMLSKDNVIIASHMQQLNKVIGSLRTEKLDLTTQLRKQQLRIVHLENLVDQLSKQVNVSNICAVYCHCTEFVRKNKERKWPIDLTVSFYSF